MAITSTGYDGTVTEAQWARLAPTVGSSHYGVGAANDLKVTSNPTLDRGVTIAAGSGWGHGVLDTSDSTASLQGATVSSGSRWDLVVARRTWGTNTTAFAIVTGSSLKALPSRNTVPGTVDDQPLALVQFTAGQSQATSIVDLRCWGRNGGMVAKDTLALGYLTHLGAQIKIGAQLWSCIPDGSGNPVWSASGTDGFTQFFNYQGALSGSVPSVPGASPEFRLQAGSIVQDTDAAGYAMITFPLAFPNGLLTVILTDGDASIGKALGRSLHLTVAGTPYHTGRKNEVIYAVYSPNGWTPAANVRHRVNYIAIGW